MYQAAETIHKKNAGGYKKIKNNESQKKALEIKICVFNFFLCVCIADTNAPHPGHDNAVVETCFLHSGQSIKAISSPL